MSVDMSQQKYMPPNNEKQQHAIWQYGLGTIRLERLASHYLRHMGPQYLTNLKPKLFFY